MLRVIRTGARLPGKEGAQELDASLLARCVAGDPLAFRAFVERYEVVVFALLSRLLGRGPHVEDLAQETFLRAFRALPGFDPNGAARVSTWLLTIGARLARDVRRRDAIASAHELDVTSRAAAACGAASPEQNSARRELAAAIERAAAELPDDQRAAFVLSEFHDFTIAEIADALDAPENTIKTRIFRARQKLARALSRFEEGL